MTDFPASRLPAVAPAVAAPPHFADRRAAHRRAVDRTLHEERALLARALDVLAQDTSAERRLAGLLALLARTVGARRAAVVADGGGSARRVAVAVGPTETNAEAEALATWLDAAAPRTRAVRAAAGSAPVSLVVLGDADFQGSPGTTPVASDRPVGAAEQTGRKFACLPIPSLGQVALGFAFDDPAEADRLADRLPPELARHAAVALALVTDQLATERELVTLRARDSERARFVSNVAHELRTPLTGLSGYLELILGGRVDDAATEREFLERSRGIVDTMAGLVGDLLELSRLESGSLRLEATGFSLAEVAGRVADALAAIALDRGIELTSSLPPRLRAATGDRRRVEQVVTNLVANALKFGPPGSRVEVAAWFDRSVALIAVRDEGPGITAADRDRIFERFYRLDAHERVRGTGLGLPIARELARAMGGGLRVASVPDSGSSFVLALPGPTAVEDGAVAATLERIIADEEIALEERAVVRALRAAGRSPKMHDSTAGGPDRSSGRDRPIAHGVAAARDSRSSSPIREVDRSPRGGQSGRVARAEPRPVRLRAIDGLLGEDEPTPA